MTAPDTVDEPITPLIAGRRPDMTRAIPFYGNRIRVTHPDGTYFTYDYDGLDRLVTVKQNGAAQIASNAYDARGQRAAAARGGVLTSYAYDDVSRLFTQADDLSGTAYDYSAGFGYNPASQITAYNRANDLYIYGLHPGHDRLCGQRAEPVHLGWERCAWL